MYPKLNSISFKKDEEIPLRIYPFIIIVFLLRGIRNKRNFFLPCVSFIDINNIPQTQRWDTGVEKFILHETKCRRKYTTGLLVKSSHYYFLITFITQFKVKHCFKNLSDEEKLCFVEKKKKYFSAFKEGHKLRTKAFHYLAKEIVPPFPASLPYLQPKRLETTESLLNRCQEYWRFQCSPNAKIPC